MAKKKTGETGSTAASTKGRRLVVIDGANALFRAFFAIPGLRAPDGTPTNAALGFINMLIKVIREEQPGYVAVALDPSGGSFRNEIYADYKATRDATPEDLRAQFPLVRELIEAHNIPILEVAGFEADDVIATLVHQAPDDVEVSIISTDKDLMQLCSETVELVDGIKERRFGPAEVVEKFGVPPEKMLDLRALVGDPSDNIPGVKGIGLKGAAKLIDEWGTLEELLEHAPEVKAKRAREALLEHAEEARISKALSALRSDVALPVDFDALERVEPDRDRLRELYTKFGFTRLLDTLDAEQGGVSPRDAKAAVKPEIPVEVLSDERALDAAVARLAKEEGLSLFLIESGGSVVDAEMVALVIACRDGASFYIPVAGGAGAQSDLFAEDGNGASEGAHLSAECVIEALRPLLAGKQARPWFGWGVKRLEAILGEHGLELGNPDFDVEVAAFLLDSAAARGIALLAMQRLGTSLKSWEEIAGKGAKARAPRSIPEAEIADWAGEQACALWGLRESLAGDLERDGLLPLFRDVEVPLIGVLARMERNGVRIDERRLTDLSSEYEVELARLEEEIYRLAGERFLVSSPKQLQVILFEKLKLTPLKKTKTGFSTNESVLEQLAPQHELPAKILAWRQLSKLKSTYLDALPKLVSQKTGRIHPSFNQLGAATGRLSASDPNVQNIPIRTSEGIKIREAFVPAEGRLMLSADYSQVELRLLAHFSEDESLLDAFEKGHDIHRRTAAEVAGIAVEDVTDDQRAQAKAVNFGIIYGSSAFGLANNLGIATAEAQEIVDKYFARYMGVRRFLDETIVHAKEAGYVTTLLGRRRYLPDLQSKNRALRSAAERMAVNTVIQGTAADLIKKAMIDVDQALAVSDLHAVMMLQVHDELVFEIPKQEVDALSALLRDKMERVHELRVPLLTEIGVGKNWREAH